MAKLKITRADGTVSEHQITPKIEWAFELYAKKGFHKAFRDDEKQSDVYWLAHECLRSAGVEVPVFGALFLDTLATSALIYLANHRGNLPMVGNGARNAIHRPVGGLSGRGRSREPDHLTATGPSASCRSRRTCDSRPGRHY